MKTRTILWLATATALQGCATSGVVTMTAETGAAMKQANIVQVVRYKTGGMSFMTPRSVGGAGLVASMTGSSELPTGESLKRAYSLPDPAEEVARRLAEKLKSEGRLSNLRVDPKELQRPLAEDTSHYRSRYRDGMVLEVSVEGHGARYGAVNWKTYTYDFFAKARLIRVADGKVLWLDTCNLSAFSDDTAKRQLDVTEFEANNGARFKDVYHYANERCSRIFADKILSISST